MNSKFIKTFAVIVIIAAGMTACGQKKNVTTDDVSGKEIGEHIGKIFAGAVGTSDGIGCRIEAVGSGQIPH